MLAQAKRRISLEHDFMDWHKDDIMYSYLLCMADFRTQDNIMYVEKALYFDYMEDVMEACGYKSKTSLRNNIKKWIDCGLIEEGTVQVGKGRRAMDLPVYIIKNYDESDKKYQLVDLDLLCKLSDTKNKHSVQIYTYLLNKFCFKENYEFTFGELREALGYKVGNNSHNATTNNRIGNILEDLQMTGYIDYEIKYTSKVLPTGEKIKTPVKILTKVAKTVNDLPEPKQVKIGE